MSKKFKRQDSTRHFRIGKNGKVKWKRPKGRHSKMRKRRVSYPRVVVVGYKTSKKLSGRINGLYPVLIHNTKELLKVGKDEAAIIAKVGAKNKLNIIKLAQEKDIKILNIKENFDNYLVPDSKFSSGQFPERQEINKEIIYKGEKSK